MESDGTPVCLRFIKKLPNSGLCKLTIPHHLGEYKLRNCVGQQIELASSPTSEQTWSGSIAVRRNKSRNEYVLQGWRLFAEAHGLHPGDQVSFELVGLRRLVIKCIQRGEPTPRRKLSASRDAAHLKPSKAAKAFANCSPSSSSFFPGTVSSTKEFPAITSNGAQPLRRMHRDLSLESIHGLAVSNYSNNRQDGNAHSLVKSSFVKAPSSPSSQSEMLDLEDSALQTTPMSNIMRLDQEKDMDMTCQLPSIFDDMCPDLDVVVPDLPPSMDFDEEPIQSSSKPSPISTPRFESNTPQFKSKTSQDSGLYSLEQDSVQDLRAFVKKAQDRLDRSSRSALQATMDLEKCMVQMPRDSSPEVQANMFRFLSALKSSLWELLLISVSDSDDLDV